MDLISNPEIPIKGEGPFFTDYLMNIQHIHPHIGLDDVDWYCEYYTYLFQHKGKITTIFNDHYALREIGQETVSRWMLTLQNRFNEIADKYDKMYKQYEENEIYDLGLGYHMTEDYEQKVNIDRNIAHNSEVGQNSMTEQNDNNTVKYGKTSDIKYKDTPKSSSSTVNNPTNENLTEEGGTDNTTDVYTSENHYDVESESYIEDNTDRANNYQKVTDKVEHDEHIINELDNWMNKYHQLDIEFVREFEECFIGIVAVM